MGSSWLINVFVTCRPFLTRKWSKMLLHPSWTLSNPSHVAKWGKAKAFLISALAFHWFWRCVQVIQQANENVFFPLERQMHFGWSIWPQNRKRVWKQQSEVYVLICISLRTSEEKTQLSVDWMPPTQIRPPSNFETHKWKIWHDIFFRTSYSRK